MAQYNAQNSLSPMIFNKTKVDTQGTRSERWRSKSVENIYDVKVAGPQAKKKLRTRAATADKNGDVSSHKATCWEEVDRVKAVHPVVACVLPSLAMDFVASSLLAVGATPLITEDPDDIPKDLLNCKAAVLDVSAPQIIVEAFIDHFNNVCSGIPLVLVASGCGVNDRKKELLLRVLDELVPTVISGRLGDIYAVSQSVIEKNATPLDSLSDLSDSSEEEVSPSIKVVLSKEKPVEGGGGNKPDIAASMSPVMKRLYKKSASPPNPKAQPNGSRSPRSPRSPSSPTPSPRTSPRSSPVPQLRGIKRLLQKKEKTGTTGLQRVPTLLPIVKMKGQFRETMMSDVTVEMALEYAQKLCVYSGSYVHLYETNVVTSGELVVEVFNSQLGMQNLHSTLPCSAGIMAAVLSCVNLKKDLHDHLCVLHCGHGLCLYHVAVEEAGALASTCEKGVVSPGLLRQHFIDALHHLDERDIRSKSLMKTHTQGLVAK